MNRVNISIQKRISSNKKAIKLVLALALPVIIENILQILLGTVDTYFVGKLNSLAIAGVGVTNLIMNIYIAFFIAIGVGTSAIVSRYIGMKDYQKARIAVKQSIYFTSFLSIFIGAISFVFAKQILMLLGAKEEILVYALPYFKVIAVPSIFLSLIIVLSSALRGGGDTKSSMKAVALANIVNIVLDYVLIFGIFNFKGYGIVGAGLATTISRGLVVIILLRILYKKKNILYIGDVRLVSENKSIFKNILKIGVPAGMEKIFMRSGQLLYNSVIISIGNVAYVAHNVASVIDGYSYLPAMGFGVAAATLVGQQLGAGNPEEAKRYGLISYFMATIMMIVIGILFFVFAPVLTNIFTNDIDIQAQATSVIRIIAFFQPMLALTSVIASALQGAGDTKIPMIATMIGIWIIRVCIGYGLAVKLELGLIGIWLAYALDITIRGIFLLLRFAKGKWKNIKVC